MYCVLVIASGRVQSRYCNPSKKRFAPDATSAGKASCSSVYRKESSAVSMRPFLPFDQRIKATFAGVEEEPSRPLGKWTFGPLKTRSKTFRPLTGANAVSGAHGRPSRCKLRSPGKSLVAADNSFGVFLPRQFLVSVKADGGGMREATDKRNADVLLKFRLVLQFPSWTEIPTGGDVAIWCAALQRVLGRTTFALDSLAEEQPVLAHRAIRRIQEAYGAFLRIHGIKLSGESQAERPCQVSRIITGYWTGRRLDQRTKSCQR